MRSNETLHSGLRDQFINGRERKNQAALVDVLKGLAGFFRLCLCMSLLFLTGISMLRAQGTAATVTGFVTDSQGAKLPSANVSFMNMATGVSQTVTTNNVGLYRITGLLPGAYRSTATMQGFKTTVRDGIDLHLEDQLSIDYALDIGSAS